MPGFYLVGFPGVVFHLQVLNGVNSLIRFNIGEVGVRIEVDIFGVDDSVAVPLPEPCRRAELPHFVGDHALIER